MGKKKAPLKLRLGDWQRLVEQPAALEELVVEGRHNDVVAELTEQLRSSGALHSASVGLKLQVLALLDRHAVALCSDAPEPLLRGLYEGVRDRLAAPADGAEGAARLRLASLQALTGLLVKLDMPQRDARLVKVHVETLFRILERSGPHAAAPPELRRCAAACLRRMEEGAPTLLLAGAKQLLDLARAETSGAAESYVMLAACVLSHGAARCLDRKSGGSSEDGQAAAEEEEEDDEVDAALRALSSIDVRALVLGGGAGSEAEAGSGVAIPCARDVSPAGTLDTAALAAAFASGRTVSAAASLQHSEDHGSPKEQPGSPRGVASVMGTISTLDSSLDSSRALSLAGLEPLAPGRLGPGCSAGSEMSGSVAVDDAAAQALLTPGGHGLRHFRVPSHLHWPDALGHAAVTAYLTPEAHADLRQACSEFLAAMPRLSVEGVACLTAALPPILRLAALPAQQLQEVLDGLLASGRTLMLQAVLKLYGEVPEGFSEWQHRLRDTVLLMVNGPHPPEQRVIAITWAMVQHHSQLHSRQPSLFAGGWRHLLPRPDDPAQLLSLKVKALSACLAVGIGRAEEICPLVFSWDGFWQERPSDQQLRLATYALRMLGSAALSYAALDPAAVARLRRCASTSSVVRPFGTARPPATPHHVKACLLASALQLLATRPQYLPALDAFLAHCASQSRELHVAALNAADSLFSAAASAGAFACLAPRPRAGLAIERRRGGGGLGAEAAAPGSPSAAAAAGSAPGSPAPSALGGVLRRMKQGLSRRFSSTSPSPDISPTEPGSLQAAAELAGGAPPAAPSEADIASIAAPAPPALLASWGEAEAWLWDSRTWAALSASMLRHDPPTYRPLLLRLAQSGPDVLPMGALRLLASYASQYQGEAPGHELPAKEAGAAVLAICQAAAMTHLLIGPAGTEAKPPADSKAAQPPGGAGGVGGAQAPGGRGRARARSCELSPIDERSSVRGSSPASSVAGPMTPQWTLQQEEVALAMTAVLSALTSHFPVDSVRRRAQSFLDLLANPAAWDLKVRMSTVARMLFTHISEAVSSANYL